MSEEIKVPDGWKLVDKIPKYGSFKMYSHTHKCFISGTCMTEPMYIIVPDKDIIVPDKDIIVPDKEAEE
jgi:hypothetical protein